LESGIALESLALIATAGHDRGAFVANAVIGMVGVPVGSSLAG